MIAYTWFVKTSAKNYLWYGLAFILFVGSCLSKGQAVTLAGVIFIIDWFLNREWKHPKFWLEKIPFLVVAIAIGLIAIKAQATAEAIADNEVWQIQQRLFLAFHSLIIYLGKCLVPIDLAAFYPYPKKVNDAIAWYYYASPVVLVLLWSVWVSLKKGKTMAFATFFFLGNIILLLQVMAVGSAVIAERYTYISYIGLFIVLSVGFLKFIEWKPKYKLAAFVGLGVYIIVLMGMTMNRCEVWENSLTLWNDCIEKRPTFQVAYNNRGNYHSKIGDHFRMAGDIKTAMEYYDKAMPDYAKTIELEPNYYNVYINRGNVYGIKGDHQAAIADYTRAISLKSNAIDAILNRAMSNAILKNYKPALEDYARALSVNPNHPTVYSMRGYTHIEMNNFEEAVSDYTAFFNLGQVDINAFYYRGFAYQKTGQIENAISDYSKALQLNPNHTGVYNNRSRAYRSVGNYLAALQDATKAKQLGYAMPESYLHELRELLK